LVSFLLVFFPSFIHVFIRKNILGNKIGSNVKIKFGTLLLSSKIEISDNSSVGPFTVIKAKSLKVGNNCKLSSLSLIKTYSVNFKNYVHIAPFVIINAPMIKGADIEIGHHSRVFPFCWLEPGEGIVIGSHVGIGGHNLIFTHGVWPNFVEGGPVAFGKVIIEDNVWLPWRVFILPDIKIGKGAIIGANSLINKSIPAGALAAGSPAKVIKENCIQTLSHEEKIDRIKVIMESFNKYLSRCNENNDSQKLTLEDSSNLKTGDVLLTYGKLNKDLIKKSREINFSLIDLSKNIIYKNSNNNYTKRFIEFLRRYGVRLTVLSDV